jgi:N-acetylglucosamine malate deacetylase 1
MNLDLLAVGAHPDDCEIFMGGTLAAMKAKGYRTAICDLTRGENGTLGDTDRRAAEARTAAEILRVDFRETLILPDGAVKNTTEQRLPLIEVIRRYRPAVMATFAANTRHPDHAQAGELTRECAYLAGLRKIETGQEPHRPNRLLRFPELKSANPDFVVDISEHWETKVRAIEAYRSQVIPYGGHNDTPPETLINSESFWWLVEARCRHAGAFIRRLYAEPFLIDDPLRIDDPVRFFSGAEGTA